MNSDELIQDLSCKIYEEPLCNTRDEKGYPDLANPLHVAILLIDCDTEITMQGMLGFLENSTGEFLSETVAALDRIGAPKSAQILRSVEQCMAKHGITWAGLRGDFEGTELYQITSFHELHGAKLDKFAKEVDQIAGDFLLLNTLYSPEDAYGALCRHIAEHRDRLSQEIETREAQPEN